MLLSVGQIHIRILSLALALPTGCFLYFCFLIASPPTWTLKRRIHNGVG